MDMDNVCQQLEVWLFFFTFNWCLIQLFVLGLYMSCKMDRKGLEGRSFTEREGCCIFSEEETTTIDFDPAFLLCCGNLLRLFIQG